MSQQYRFKGESKQDRRKLNYDDELLQFVFEQLLAETGVPWSPDDYVWGRFKPWSLKKLMSVLVRIHLKCEKKFPHLVRRKITLKEQGEGKTGLHNKLQWVVSPQRLDPSSRNHRDRVKQRNAARMAAYRAGFLSLEMIHFLEQEELKAAA